MRFNKLVIRNFRSIKNLELNISSHMVVIAGPNGCGKSNIFHAIRLLKSVYGGYQPNEWQRWFNEFQISLDMTEDQLRPMFYDKEKDLKIVAEIFLEDEEKKLIRKHLERNIRSLLWSEIIPDYATSKYHRGQSIVSQKERYGDDVNKRTLEVKDEIHMQLEKKYLAAEVTISLNSQDPITVKRSPILGLIFSQYKPENTGIIDYHPPERTYQREMISSVNLKISTNEKRIEENALYNTQNKFSNIKNEMAASYIREILSKKAGGDLVGSESLESSLSDLFSTFFPGKTFVGPRPTKSGNLSFSVRTKEGKEHDINELSSGEKEVLFGYLRLYNLSPKYSTLLIDEPELHLNPSLVQGLPQFYLRQLGKPFSNQMWLLTHSDAMLREALSTPDTQVFHMLLPTTIKEDENQVRRVTENDEIEQAIIDLVGDLATYKPQSKVVILEGSEDTRFDISFVKNLFPEIENKLNLISGGSKNEVKNLYLLLTKASEVGSIPERIFSITDKDSEQIFPNSKNQFTWDVYHIENYLLNSRYIQQALIAIGQNRDIYDEDTINEYLKKCAERVKHKLIIHSLKKHANSIILDQIKLNFDPQSTDIVDDMDKAIGRSIHNIQSEIKESLSKESLSKTEKSLREKLNLDLENDEWLKTFRGRDILKCFVSEYINGINYERFRNLIISKMREEAYQPDGMKAVLGKIISS